MKSIYKFLFTISCIAACYACSKEERLMFDEPAGIYFYDGTNVVDKDSVDYSFIIKPDTLVQDTVYLYLRISGEASDVDRAVNIGFTGKTTAIEGKHFTLTPPVIKAGEYDAEVPVYLHRTEDMQDSTFVIQFEIKDNEVFRQGPTDRLLYKITVTDQLIKPSDWQTLFYGSYSKVKHQFMVSRLGTTAITISTGAQFSQIMSILQKMRVELLNYEKENGPLFDENGDRVTFPTL
ncbi:hypothetical protein COR50_02135 [Chitinophaga caeni]|uniref:DUF4843 domain-containing protein n=1 Tax=Chitinophaga caeni TaxID=2029983 RepID=A0A291QQ45_9BACT|nr:DUF4843 domain-containing protein [Chitinophaga caeni]ATL46056.1 hypothetical protein COR50_02135 [Chitinophaga caeni]